MCGFGRTEKFWVLIVVLLVVSWMRNAEDIILNYDFWNTHCVFGLCRERLRDQLSFLVGLRRRERCKKEASVKL